MNETHTLQLVIDFARLYRRRNKITCGDGWFPIIHKLSSDIEKLARQAGQSPDSEIWPVVSQVKEKFGKLHFSVLHKLDEAAVMQLISEAEAKSAVTCECCGKPGEMLNDNFWWRVRCKQCSKKPRKLPQPYL